MNIFVFSMEKSYAGGLAVIAAKSADEAKELLLGKCADDDDFDYYNYYQWTLVKTITSMPNVAGIIAKGSYAE